MDYDYDKNEIKNSLEITQVQDLLAEMGGEPQIMGDVIWSKTICHGGDSHKLYYYDNTKLFHCYTGCADATFDIFELVRKVKSRETGTEWELPFAIHFVAQYFGFAAIDKTFDDVESIPQDDLTLFKNYDRINNIDIKTQRVELKEYDDTIIKNLPRPKIQAWIDDGISQEVMNHFEICYDPKNVGIVIPHRDIDGKLIGIRERTLVKENERFGKYRPAKFYKQMYNHPLGFNLYGINYNKQNIINSRKAMVFESEKSVMQYATMFGQENNIAVAVCGSSFIQYQAWLLMKLGVTEIVVGLDKQYQEIGDNEHKKLVRNLENIHKKYGKFVNITYLFDTEDLLGYKESPTDRDKETFLELYKKRFNIY